MKVLGISHSFPTLDRPYVTPFVKYFSEALGRQKGMEVHLLIPHAENAAARDIVLHTFKVGKKDRISHKKIGYEYKRISYFEQVGFLISGIMRARKIVSEQKIDVIHAHWTLPSGLIACIVSKLTGVPYLVTTHGRDVLYEPKVGHTVSGHFLYRRVIKKILDLADRVITTSPTTDIAASNISNRARREMIPVGIDDDWLEEPAGPQARALKNALIFAGDLIPLKGCNVFLDAVAASPALRCKKIYVVGGGVEREALLEQSRRLNLTDVEFAGSVSHGDLERYFALADVFVFASLIEAFGIVVLEALASGMPVVGSDIGVLSILKGDPLLSKFVFPARPGDAESLREQLEVCCRSYPAMDRAEVRRKIRQDYSWDKIAERYIRVYRELSDQ